MRPSLPPPGRRPRGCRDLSADGLIRRVRQALAHVPDHRFRTPQISLVNAPGFAPLRTLKDPSLPAFDQRRHDENMKKLSGIQTVPSDTQMREILDPAEPADLSPAYSVVFRLLQRGKGLEPLVFYQGHYLISLEAPLPFRRRRFTARRVWNRGIGGPAR